MRMIWSAHHDGVDLIIHPIEQLAEVGISLGFGNFAEAAPRIFASTSHSETTFSPPAAASWASPRPPTPITAMFNFSPGDDPWISAGAPNVVAAPIVADVHRNAR